MKMKDGRHNRKGLFLVLALLFFSNTALAVMAGSVIENTATIDYASESEGAQQIQSNPANFTVDRLLSVTVQPMDADLIEVFPNMSDAVMRFNVINTSNAIIDLHLGALATVWDGVATSNNVSLQNIRVFVDDGNSVFEPDIDNLTYIDDLAPRDNKTVYVLVDIPERAEVEEVFGISLNARIAEPGPLDQTETVSFQGPLILKDDSGNVANAQDPPAENINKNLNLNQVLDVFADPKGDLQSDITVFGIKDERFNAQHAASNGYQLNPAPFYLSKTAEIIDDDGGNVPYAGATIRYILEARALSDLSNLLISDAIPEGTEYVPNSIQLNAQPLTDNADADVGSFLNGKIDIQIGTLNKNQIQTISFDVVIQ